MKKYIIPTYAHPLVQELYVRMNEKGKTLSELALAAGSYDVETLCSRSWMKNPDIETLEKLFAALECSIIVVWGRRPTSASYIQPYTYREPANDSIPPEYRPPLHLI